MEFKMEFKMEFISILLALGISEQVVLEYITSLYENVCKLEDIDDCMDAIQEYLCEYLQDNIQQNELQEALDSIKQQLKKRIHLGLAGPFVLYSPDTITPDTITPDPVETIETIETIVHSPLKSSNSQLKSINNHIISKYAFNLPQELTQDESGNYHLNPTKSSSNDSPLTKNTNTLHVIQQQQKQRAQDKLKHSQTILENKLALEKQKLDLENRKKKSQKKEKKRM